MENNPKCQKLNLMSYLMEPFQRFLRYPLLLKEVIKHFKGNEKDDDDTEESLRAEKALETVKPVKYRQTSNISRTSVGNMIVGHSDVVGASPVGAAPTTSSYST